MHKKQEMAAILEKSSLNLYKTVTSSLNNGGAVTFQIKDALDFVFYNKDANEIEFLSHLFRTNSLTQEALECFFKHMMFNKETASSFVQWQREKSSFIT
jgi:hypothetical protein